MTESVQAQDQQAQAEALAKIGLTIEGAIAQYEEATASSARNRDRRICVCGHGFSRHYAGRGYSRCNPAKMSCPCESLIPVVEASDNRCFLWITTGYGKEHALVKGIQSIVKKGKTWKWIDEDPKCFRCERTGQTVTPCAVNAAWKISHVPEKVNALLCDDCIAEIGVV